MFNRNANRTWMTKRNKRNCFVAGLIFSLIITIAACSPKSGSGFLKFMFDGVPEGKPKDTIAAVIKLIPDSSNAASTSTASSGLNGVFYHAPYKDRACIKCHDTGMPGKIKYSQDEFCYSCHESYQKKYPVVHGPVAGGFCTACHAPHFSDNKKLLIRKGQSLCLGCHDPALVMKEEAHLEIGNKNCIECHNPHGGNDRYLSN